MKVIVFGAGDYGRRFCQEADSSIEILAIVDNNILLQGSSIYGHMVVPASSIANYDFDKVVIAIIEYIGAEQKCAATKVLEQLNEMGVANDKIQLMSKYPYENPRVKLLKLFSSLGQCVPGAVAECGVHRGDFAAYINEFFPSRSLYLFDTFDGFRGNDVNEENSVAALQWLECVSGIYTSGSAAAAMLKMPYRDKVIVRQGYVPDTFVGLESERFAFVSLDVDLYKPTLEGLKFFAPRMSPGGMILLHDYFSINLSDSVKRAADEFESGYSFTKLPLNDGYTIALANFEKKPN